jgi:hypothetical protein
MIRDRTGAGLGFGFRQVLGCLTFGVVLADPTPVLVIARAACGLIRTQPWRAAWVMCMCAPIRRRLAVFVILDGRFVTVPCPKGRGWLGLGLELVREDNPAIR